MIVGVPREIMPREGRVAATPWTVRQMRGAGFTVLVEAGAGQESDISDQGFREAGAEMVSVEAIWSRSEVVLKVKQPLFNADLGLHEAELLPEGRCLITFLHPANCLDVVEILRRRNITAFTMDSIPRTPDAHSMDALSSMSLLAGYRAAIIAANHAPRMFGAADLDIAYLEPTRVLIVGFGVVGRAASRICMQLGAKVSVIDLSDEALQKAASLGARAVALTSEQKDHPETGVMEAIASELSSSDVVILGVLVFGQKAPILVTREMLKLMPWRSVVVDVSVDQGGNCEATQAGDTIEVNGVKVVGIMNLPGQIPADATQLYSRNVANFLLHISREGQIDIGDEIAQAALVTSSGNIVHKGTLKALSEASRPA